MATGGTGLRVINKQTHKLSKTPLAAYGTLVNGITGRKFRGIIFANLFRTLDKQNVDKSRRQ
uniref:Transposase n=1 Tax=Heterorhabditis bacteriophora TaxID=37862 RepID=A0A1I7W725_HETBA